MSLQSDAATATWRVSNLAYRGPGHLIRRRKLEVKSRSNYDNNGRSPAYTGVTKAPWEA